MSKVLQMLEVLTRGMAWQALGEPSMAGIMLQWEKPCRAWRRGALLMQ